MKGLDITSRDAPRIAEGIDAVNANLERLLFQSLREVPGHLDVGSKLVEYFWEPATQKTVSQMIEEVKFVIGTYEKRIELKEVVVNILDIDVANRGIHIAIKYSLIASQDVVSIDFNKIVEI